MRTLVALGLMAGPLAAQEVDVGIRLREWFVRYDGALTADGRPDNGTRLDASEIGLDSPQLAHEFQLSLHVAGVGRVAFGYGRVRLEGDEVLAGDVNFDGRSFPAGTAVDASLAFDLFSLDYEYPLTRGAVELDLLLGARYVSAEADLEGGGFDEHANLNRPLLLPGLHGAGALLPWLRADVRAQGTAFSAHNVRARYVEAEAGLVAEALPGFDVSLGYRRIWTYFKAREESLNFDVDGVLEGLFLSVGYRF
jgi:hypothetical protein